MELNPSFQETSAKVSIESQKMKKIWEIQMQRLHHNWTSKSIWNEHKLQKVILIC